MCMLCFVMLCHVTLRRVHDMTCEGSDDGVVCICPLARAPVSLLWRAISEVDDVTGRGRGYFLMSRGRPSSSFTPLSSACRIAADRIAWEKLAEYFCDQLPYKLREAQCKTPKQVRKFEWRMLDHMSCRGPKNMSTCMHVV